MDETKTNLSGIEIDKQDYERVMAQGKKEDVERLLEYNLIKFKETGKARGVINVLSEFINVTNVLIKEQEEAKETKQEIILPKAGKLISNFAYEIVNILAKKNIIFFRADSREVVEIGSIKDEREQVYSGFIPLKPNRFITFVERYFTPGLMQLIVNEEGERWIFKQKSMGGDLANTILQSHILEDALPHINRIFTVPLPII